jgi:hypothetical protein
MLAPGKRQSAKNRSEMKWLLMIGKVSGKFTRTQQQVWRELAQTKTGKSVNRRTILLDIINVNFLYLRPMGTIPPQNKTIV